MPTDLNADRLASVRLPGWLTGSAAASPSLDPGGSAAPSPREGPGGVPDERPAAGAGEPVALASGTPSPPGAGEPDGHRAAAAPSSPGRGAGRRIARNSAIFSVATGFSRIAGLVREVVASSYFGTSGPASAFTLAFQVPNLVRSLVADAALSSAFVPVFTELLEQDRRRDALRLASTLFLGITLVLGFVTAGFIVAAPAIMPAFTGDTFTPALDALTVGLSQVLFPIVVLLGLNGLVVGILNAYDHFSVPALAPLVWNLVIIGLLIALRPLFDGPDQLYAYAIGVLVGTLVQFVMVLPVLRRVGFGLTLAFDWRDPRLRRVLVLMLPVTIGLGVINFDLFLNSTLGLLVSKEAPSAIDRAFRIYMLPQGMFSVALATVLFPALSRLAARRDLAGLRETMGSGVRLICLLLVPAAVLTLVLAEPITRVVYERGEFGPASTDQVAEALFWFSFSLPFAGVNLLLTRTFFSLQRPWAPTVLAVGSLAINAATSLALYRALGIGGLVIGTAVGSAAMAAGQAWALRRALGPLDGARTLGALARIGLASVGLAVLAAGVHRGLADALGDGLGAQVLAVGAAISAGSLAYGGAVLLLGLPEARQFEGLLRRRLGRSG